jgi:beta-glucanase (GH16 family)
MSWQPKISLAGFALALAWMLLVSVSVPAATRPGTKPIRHHHGVKRHPKARRPIRKDRRTPVSDPSGVPMPTGNLPGWQEVFSDNFTGRVLDRQWGSYRGQPGGDPGGFFDPTHVTVSGGELVISAYKDPSDDRWDAGPGTYVTGGISSAPSFAQTYGKYLVRFRMARGQGIAPAILLWPQGNSWPPEIDFSENNGSNRLTDYATLHYGTNNAQVQRRVAVNLSHWHTLGVQWTPGRLVYTLDGRDWATVINANVPSIPMVLDIQTQGWACGTSAWEQCPNAETPSRVNLYVDWVVAYRRT